MSKNYITKENGILVYHYDPEPVPISAEDTAIMDKILDSIAQSNHLTHSIENAIEEDNYPKFMELMDIYHNKLGLEDKVINIREKNIELFLGILEKKENPTLIDNAIKYLKNGDFINEEFLIISLWALYYDEKTTELIYTSTVKFTEKRYNVFFDIFRPQTIFQSKLPFGLTQTEDFLENRKIDFFNIAKVTFYNELNEKIPAKCEVNKNKLKI